MDMWVGTRSISYSKSGAVLSKSSMYVYVSIRTVVDGNRNDD